VGSRREKREETPPTEVAEGGVQRNDLRFVSMKRHAGIGKLRRRVRRNEMLTRHPGAELRERA